MRLIGRWTGCLACAGGVCVAVVTSQRPNAVEAWLTGSAVALETLRSVASQPTGRSVNEIEKRLGDAVGVVRTLNRMQQLGLIEIQVDRKTSELIVRVSKDNEVRLKELLARLS